MVKVIDIVDVSPEFRGGIFCGPRAVLVAAVSVHPGPIGVREWVPTGWMRWDIGVAVIIGDGPGSGKILPGAGCRWCGSLCGRGRSGTLRWCRNCRGRRLFDSGVSL